jgi:hypothetical protein
VRDGPRDALQPDREAHVQLLDHDDQRRDEPLPLRVRLGAGEKQERRAARVAKHVDVDRRALVALPAIGVEDDRRAPRAVVEQLVDVEARDQLRVERLAEMLPREPDPVPCVYESLERLDQHRPAQIRLRKELDELCRVAHLPTLAECRVARAPAG